MIGRNVGGCFLKELGSADAGCQKNSPGFKASSSHVCAHQGLGTLKSTQSELGKTLIAAREMILCLRDPLNNWLGSTSSQMII